MAETSNGAANGQAQQGQAQLSLQKIYVKDVSFEAPGAPQIFQSQATQPNVELNLSQRVTQLGEAAFEVVLSVTATCKIEDKTAYLAEVQEALRPQLCDDAGKWTADYTRLRFKAIKR